MHNLYPRTTNLNVEWHVDRFRASCPTFKSEEPQCWSPKGFRAFLVERCGTDELCDLSATTCDLAWSKTLKELQIDLKMIKIDKDSRYWHAT